MKVLILGLGQYPKGSGVAAALYFAKRRDEVFVQDLKSAHELRDNVDQLKKFMNVRLHLAGHDARDVKAADLVVRNPRVREDLPELVLARKLGKRIESDITLFLDRCPGRVIGVTGTRGKSTTSTLVYEMLKAGKKKAWLGGNISVSPLTFLSRVKKGDWVVLELSSWQLEELGKRGISPPIAAWTNLMRDHLNTYSGMEEYAEAKAQIFRHQQPQDVVFLPSERGFDVFAKEAPGKAYRYGKKGSREARIVASTKLKLLGEHNRRNAEIATSVALEAGVSVSAIKKVLRSFVGLKDRLELIAIKKGIRFVNDTTATTPDGTIAAVRALHAPHSTIHLIFGGNDKELEFEEVAQVLKKHRVDVSLIPGSAYVKIVKAFEKSGVTFTDVPFLAEALARAVSCAKKGDVVLLSPGCTSFGQFKNEFDRGEQFVKLVKSLRL